MSRDDKNLRSTLAQIATVIVVFIAIAVGLLAYAVLRPQPHYAPVKIDQHIQVQVTWPQSSTGSCPGNGGTWTPSVVNGKG